MGGCLIQNSLSTPNNIEVISSANLAGGHCQINKNLATENTTINLSKNNIKTSTNTLKGQTQSYQIVIESRKKAIEELLCVKVENDKGEDMRYSSQFPPSVPQSTVSSSLAQNTPSNIAFSSDVSNNLPYTQEQTEAPQVR